MERHTSLWTWGLIVVGSVILIGFLDYITGYELNFFVFYFVPVALAAWHMGFGASLTASFLGRRLVRGRSAER